LPACPRLRLLLACAPPCSQVIPSRGSSANTAAPSPPPVLSLTRHHAPVRRPAPASRPPPPEPPPPNLPPSDPPLQRPPLPEQPSPEPPSSLPPMPSEPARPLAPTTPDARPGGCTARRVALWCRALPTDRLRPVLAGPPVALIHSRHAAPPPLPPGHPHPHSPPRTACVMAARRTSRRAPSPSARATSPPPNLAPSDPPLRRPPLLEQPMCKPPSPLPPRHCCQSWRTLWSLAPRNTRSQM
jgi:hypothetical protein